MGQPFSYAVLQIRVQKIYVQSASNAAEFTCRIASMVAEKIDTHISVGHNRS